MSVHAYSLDAIPTDPNRRDRALATRTSRTSESQAVCTTMPAAARGAAAERLFRVLETPSFDPIDGPTHQPGVMPGPHYEALRTPFGEVGIPGALLEHNVTDLDLVKNRHKPGERFRP